MIISWPLPLETGLKAVAAFVAGGQALTLVKQAPSA
jgi:hypothetical protein